MKNTLLKKLALGLSGVFVVSAAHASADYGPAIWRPAASGHWYTSGFGKKFYVIHDIEGSYWSCISYFQQASTQASVHYVVNGKKDNTSDSNPGEVTQMVADANYAWHALCWNQHSMGTEHEGFASNPAWFTPELYDASAALTKSKAEKYGFAKDRNHIIGHDQKRIAGWSSWASANLGIDPNCNSHTDPGLYWDWAGYMARINPAAAAIVDNSSAGFSTSANWSTGSSSPDKYGADYRFRSTAAVSDPATWTANLPSTKSYGVYVWYPQGSNRSTTAPYIVYHAAGSTTAVVNQQITGGQWVYQGSWNMNAGSNQVKLSCWTTTGFVVVADAVKWQ